MRGREIDDAERTAAMVERLAALLAGGTSAASAWQHAATFGEGDASRRAPSRWRLAGRTRVDELVEVSVARGVRGGASAASLLVGHRLPSWRALGCAWWLAERTGAPLARCLAELAETFRDYAQSERDIEIALAGPVGAARLVMMLPLAGLLLGLLLGFDTVGILLGNPLGWACLATAVVLMLAARTWNAALIRTAAARDRLPGFALDLTALGMRGGAGAEQVLMLVEQSMANSGLLRGGDAARRVLALAGAAGVPAAELLRSEARLARRSGRTAASVRAAELGIKLMLPLGVCILPAFMLLGVAPLLLAVITQTIAGL